MILIADSGSTKCDWALISHDSDIRYFSSIGFNPLFHDSEFITNNLLTHPDLLNYSASVETIYYYGTSCSSPVKNGIVENGLKNVFVNAKIFVNHDLTGSVRALCGDEAGIACILGTGSNCCLFDGEKIIQNIPSLGFILGDEGSGAWFGKRLLADYLYRKLPFHLEEEFIETYSIFKEDILNSVYKEPGANVFLASFMPFLQTHSHNTYVRKLMNEGFSDFFEKHIRAYEDSLYLPVHYVGSVAFHFKEFLYEVGSKYFLKIGKVIKTPLEGLIGYHLKNHY